MTDKKTNKIDKKLDEQDSLEGIKKLVGFGVWLVRSIDAEEKASSALRAYSAFVKLWAKEGIKMIEETEKQIEERRWKKSR